MTPNASPPPSYRTALVTGASRGIGAAIVRRLRAMGLEVHALARDEARLNALADETGAIPLVGDVTDPGTLSKITALPVDVLVNNAGLVAAVAKFHELAPDAIDRMIEVNLRAPLRVIRAVLPGMVERARGHVVNIGSTAGSYVFAGTAPYGAAKAGLSAAGRVIRYDLVGTGVRLTEVSPGRVETDIYLEAFAGDRAALGKLYDKVRSLSPDDVAAAVATAIALPEQVDVSFLEIVPTDQATGGHAIAERR